MSEKAKEVCGLCGGNALRLPTMETVWNEERDWECPLCNVGMPLEHFNRLQSSLSFDTPENRGLVERVRKGESVEVRKKGGEWPVASPFITCGPLVKLWRVGCFRMDGCGRGFVGTYQEAAAAWNGGEG